MIEVPKCVLPCDLILLSGSVIVNESMLTGESVPVIKNFMNNSAKEVYRSKESDKCTLYGGTKVI